MTFKKILGLLALACLTIIGLSACTPEKEPTWTYDKNKMLCTADSLRAGDTVTVQGAAKLAHCTVISVEEQDESTQNR